MLALLLRFRGKTVAARDTRGDIGIPLLEYLALSEWGEASINGQVAISWRNAYVETCQE